MTIGLKDILMLGIGFVSQNKKAQEFVVKVTKEAYSEIKSEYAKYQNGDK